LFFWPYPSCLAPARLRRLHPKALKNDWLKGASQFSRPAFRQGKQNTADNTARIIKGFCAALAEGRV